MAYITGTDGITRKYACHTCIKGHRSTKCNHTNREMVEVKRKGRPISQCEACRELRKTKQLHIKCICGGSSSRVDTTIVASPTTSTADDASQPATPSSTATTASIATTRTTKSTPTSSSCTFASISPCDNDLNTPPAKPASAMAVRCTSCNRSPCFCLSIKPELYDTCASTTTSPATTDSGSPNTPEDIIALHRIPPPVSSLILPPIRFPLPSAASTLLSPLPTSLHYHRRRKHPIPIHDPYDDIDSDTPIYKSEENNAPDRGAVLGNLSEAKHEDLMEEIYRPFQPPPRKRHRTAATSREEGCELEQHRSK